VELGLGIVPVAVELERAPAVEEQELARVRAELERGPVAAELAPVQEEAVPARGHPRVQPAVAPTTKSVTAAHRPDLVPLRVAEEGLAEVVAVTTREPAVAEAVIAWEVADTAAVEEAAVVEAAAVAVEAADGDKPSMRKNK
jgi:hypothetical protein